MTMTSSDILRELHNRLSTILGIFLLLNTLLVVHLLSIRYRKHLRSIPGPFLASFTPVPRLLSCARGQQYATHVDYHNKYGPVVRIGPNHVSFSDGETLSRVYHINTRFQKSEFYAPFDAKTPYGVVPTSFSIRDERAHRIMKRPVFNAFSVAAMKELEPLADNAIKIFQSKLDEKLSETTEGNSQGNIVLNLGDWLHFFAFDVITSITFSNMMGFMQHERDVDNIIEAIEGRLKYNAVIGQAPYLHKYLLGNNSIEWLANLIPAFRRLNTSRYIIQFTINQLKRYQEKDTEKVEYRDMLDRFKRTGKDPETGETINTMSDSDLLSHAAGNIFAGSDTTAISLRSVFYYFCKNLQCYRKAQAEIDGADRQGKLSDPVTSDESTEHLPYLQASMKEAMRLHPAVGLMLERVVPPEGVTISGHFVPGGTVVGANPWVVARAKDVYGEDADDFRPERWMEANPDQLKLMERNFLTFGAGSRTCLGKNVSLMEMNKLIPSILRKYVVELDDPAQEWKVTDYWFTKQTGLICRISKREQ